MCSSDLRRVVALRVLLDLSAQQTADELGIDAGTVGTHLHRALATLRARMGDRQVDDRPAVLSGVTTVPQAPAPQSLSTTTEGDHR